MNKLEFLTEIIYKRQSIFPASFTGELIADEVVTKILENANQAPSHKHTEPWRFHIVSGEAKSTYCRFVQQAYKAYVPEEKFKQSKYDKLAKKISNASHIIMIGCRYDKASNLPEWEEVAAVACAVQNIYLSLTAAELGGYWSSPEFLIENAHLYFDMEEDEVSLGVFYVGVLKNVIPPPVRKGDISEKIKLYK